MKKLFAILMILCLVNTIHAQDSLADKARDTKPFLNEKAKAYMISLHLVTIQVEKEQLWLGFTIHNYSKLSYPVDFIRLYIKDRKQTKRTSAQELEIVPIYIDSVTNVPAKSTVRFVIAIPKFTIPDKKECLIEIFETNGGRNLILQLKNHMLFKAKPL